MGSSLSYSESSENGDGKLCAIQAAYISVCLFQLFQKAHNDSMLSYLEGSMRNFINQSTIASFRANVQFELRAKKNKTCTDNAIMSFVISIVFLYRRFIEKCHGSVSAPLKAPKKYICAFWKFIHIFVRRKCSNIVNGNAGSIQWIRCIKSYSWLNLLIIVVLSVWV